MGTWACGACGRDNPEGTKFCGHCGAPAPATWTCSACGTENPEDTKFCGHCGTAASGAPPGEGPPPRPQPGPAPQPHPPPRQDASPTDVTDALRSFVATSVADRVVEEGGKFTEERRLVTAVFGDISGFTSLSERMDPEELQEVIDPVITRLSDVVGKYEGFVEKFAGDALLALFGAPVSHEDDATRACLVGLEMHHELARIVRELPPEAQHLTLHVGINSGHGIARILGSQVRMDYAVLGDAVILAQRLESAAPAGQTYVGEITYQLTRDRFEYESVGELTLKGKSEPVPAWRLIGERKSSRADRAHKRGGRLVGRQRELDAVTRVLDTLDEGRGGIVSVTGEAGVGKSRLTEEVWQRAQERGVRWLQARCLSYGAGLAYWPYVDLLRRLPGVSQDEAPGDAASHLASLLERNAVGQAFPYLARLLGLPLLGRGQEVPELEPEAFRRGLHEAFSSWARALSAKNPVVIALEDVHWADASSLELTSDLVRLSRDERVVLYLTGRPEAAAPIAEIAAVADAEAREHVMLEPLDETGVGELVDGLLRGAASRGLARMVTERTAGNPFFVEELVRSLQDTGVLLAEDGAWRMKRGWDAETIPPTIEGVLSGRIDRLRRPAASLLQTASVIGRQVPVPLLEAVADDVALQEPLAQLIDSGFLDRSGEEREETLLFHHALVQEAAYSRLLRRQRRQLHLKVAEVAEQIYGARDDVVDLLARHLYLGQAGSKAIDYLVRAGERAKRLFANEEAIVHFTRAAELARADAQASGRLPDILLTLADLHELVGDYDQALELYSEVRDATNDVRAWRGIASTLRRRGDYERALATLEGAFMKVRSRAVDTRPLWLERAWTLLVGGRLDEAIEAAKQGLEATSSRHDALAGQLILQISNAESIAGRYGVAIDNALEARRIFELHDDTRGLASAMRILGGAYWYLDRLDEAAGALRRGLALAERIGSVEEIGGCLINLGAVELARGALEEAIACDRRAIEEFERIGHASGRAVGYSNLAEKLMRVGDKEEALRYCDRALEVARALGDTLAVADTLQIVASIRLAQGDYREAARRAEEAVALFVQMGVDDSATESAKLASDAWRHAGETERALQVPTRAGSPP